MVASNHDHLPPAPGNPVPNHEHPYTASRTKSSMNIFPGDNQAEASGGPVATNQSQEQVSILVKAYLPPVARNKRPLRRLLGEILPLLRALHLSMIRFHHPVRRKAVTRHQLSFGRVDGLHERRFRRQMRRAAAIRAVNGLIAHSSDHLG